MIIQKQLYDDIYKLKSNIKGKRIKNVIDNKSYSEIITDIKYIERFVEV